jgi:hypothetical protein
MHEMEHRDLTDQELKGSKPHEKICGGDEWQGTFRHDCCCASHVGLFGYRRDGISVGRPGRASGHVPFRKRKPPDESGDTPAGWP